MSADKPIKAEPEEEFDVQEALPIKEEMEAASINPEDEFDLVPSENALPIKEEMEVASINPEDEFDLGPSENALPIKEEMEVASINPENEFDLGPPSENQQQEAIQDTLLRRKKAKLAFLRTEASLIELDAAIKTNLGLDKALPKAALKELNVMLNLNVKSLMLKKHPHVMEMVGRLRKYVGNVQKWKLEKKELDEFEKDAQQIRNMAEALYAKFEALFNVPDDKAFWEVFYEECEKFNNLTKDMTENQMFILTVEPDTREAEWDKIYDQEKRMLYAKINSKRIEKKIKKIKRKNRLLMRELANQILLSNPQLFRNN